MAPITAPPCGSATRPLSDMAWEDPVDGRKQSSTAATNTLRMVMAANHNYLIAEQY